MIRDATHDDIAAIGALWNHYVRHSTATFRSTPLSDDQLRDILEECRVNNWPFLVARDDEFLGFALFRKFRAVGYDKTMEHSVYLSPYAQKRGLGSQFIEALKVHAQTIGIHALIGMVTAENQASIKFHQKHGFDLVAVLPQVGFKDDRLLDVAIMQNILQPK